MATLRLSAGGSARCPEGMLTLDWRVAGGSPADVALEVNQVASPATPAVAVSPTGSGKVLIAALPEAVEVQVSPVSGDTFGNGVTVSTQLTLRVGGVEAAQYLLPEADVSGTPRTTLLRLTPQPGFWQLDVPTDVEVQQSAPAASAPRPAVSSEPETDLDGLARDAAYAARRRAGSARLPEDRRSELHLAVDRSASMLPLVRGGSGQGVMDVVVGVNDVVGSSSTVALWSLGSIPVPMRPGLTRASAAGRWSAELAERASTGGTLVAPLVSETAGSGPRRTVLVLTDGPPADLPELAAALQSARQAGTSTRWHVLALARTAGDRQVQRDPWRDELASLAPLVRDGLLTCSGITPGEREGWLPELLADEAELARVVDALPFWQTP